MTSFFCLLMIISEENDKFLIATIKKIGKNSSRKSYSEKNIFFQVEIDKLDPSFLKTMVSFHILYNHYGYHAMYHQSYK